MGFQKSFGNQRTLLVGTALLALAATACDNSASTTDRNRDEQVDAGPQPDLTQDGSMPGDDAAAARGSYAISDFAYQEPRDPDFQPLTRRSYRAVRSDELALFVPNQAASNEGFAIDDRVQDRGVFASLATSPAGQIFDLVRADIDADGNDEALIVRLLPDGSVTLNVAELNGSALEERVLATVPGASKIYARLSAGDLDGDLRDEPIVATLDANGTLRVDVYEDNLDLKLLTTREFPTTSLFDVSRGDFDGDGIDELVVLRKGTDNAVQALFFALEAGELVAKGTLDGAALGLNESGYDNRRLQVIAGDLDGDGRDEVIFGAIRHELQGGTTELKLFAHEDSESAHTFIEELEIGLSIDYWPLDERINFHLATADTNGDQRAEVVALLPDIDQSAGSQRRYYLTHFSFLNDTLGDQRFDQVVHRTTVTHNKTVHQESGGWLSVLDDERSGRDTVAVAVLDAQIGDPDENARELELYRYRAKYQRDAWNLIEHEREAFPLTTHASERERWINPVILGLDLDADSLKLEYTGEKWLSLPEPFVLVVMAAPPVQQGLTQNYDNSGTAYGHQVSKGQSEAEEIGTSVGATVSFESPALAELFSVQASASIERELAKTHTNTEIETYGTSFGGSALHDYVIFQGTLYTSYKYKVVAAADPSAIGTFMTIDEPVSTKLYKWTLDYFNESITDSSYHVGPEVFVHRPGEVASYGDGSRKNSLLNQYDGWQSNPVTTLGQGEGANSTSIDLTKEVTDSTALNITKSVSAGGSVAGLGFEGSFSLNEGQEWSISVGSQLSYEGTVGDLADPAEYMDYAYSFGLFVYNWKAQDGARSFQVIDYWVEALGPGYAESTHD